ncbi:hypothetical protein LPAF129_10000 [Ligilactobacillus pabuli]|uniref:Uncharacterized protein n=1 Tax=Ligilactobacillus pabuli TaxID=2886039 RepID=A0ABQ5JJI5_9LACO|nr:hypothetical protein LPAF129_10000 [Ligilactobacillus pabuli]
MEKPNIIGLACVLVQRLRKSKEFNWNDLRVILLTTSEIIHEPSQIKLCGYININLHFVV